MAKPIRIATAGLRELQGRMKRMGTALEPKDLSPVLLQAVTLIRDRALENYMALGLKVKTGNLLRAFRAAASKSPTVAGAWTKAGTTGKKKNQAVSANHAHLIEYGHRIVGHRLTAKSFSRGMTSGKNDTGKRSRAFPFFRPAVDAMRAQVRKTIDEGIAKLLWDSEK